MEHLFFCDSLAFNLQCRNQVDAIAWVNGSTIALETWTHLESTRGLSIMWLSSSRAGLDLFSIAWQTALSSSQHSRSSMQPRIFAYMWLLFIVRTFRSAIAQQILHHFPVQYSPIPDSAWGGSDYTQCHWHLGGLQRVKRLRPSHQSPWSLRLDHLSAELRASSPSWCFPSWWSSPGWRTRESCNF